MSRQRAAASSTDAPAAASRRLAPPETIIDAIDGGRNPKVLHKNVILELQSATVDAFAEGSGITCGEGESRCYVLAEVDDISRFLPGFCVREPHCALVDWSLLKLLPPDWYVLVFREKSGGRYRAVPERLLALDSYPSTKASDPEKDDGFASRKDLRLVLYPNAFRFFWREVHEPLRAAGAWPTAREVMKRGYVLSEEVRAALDLKLNAACPAGAAWSAAFRAAIRERHWPRAGEGATSCVDSFLGPLVFPRKHFISRISDLIAAPG